VFQIGSRFADGVEHHAAAGFGFVLLVIFIITTIPPVTTWT